MRTQHKKNPRRNWRRQSVHGLACLMLCLGGLALLGDGVIASAKSPTPGTVSAGNSFYQVHVQDIQGLGVGLYTATTGASHPAGAGLNVLFGNGEPGTSFNTIHSYTTGTDYIQRMSGAGGTTVVLDSFGVVTALGSTGFRTTYTLPGPPTTPDAMTIVQDVKVNGTTFEDSTIEITTTIVNDGTNSSQVGVRYFLDYQIGSDDGPIFQPVNSVDQPRGCNQFVTETEILNPDIEAYRIVDNDVNADPPTFNIFGTVVGPSTVTPTPTPPDLLQYVCWPSAVGTVFNYTVQPTRDIATTASDCQSGTGGGDTAVSYFFGASSASALDISSGDSITVSASLFLRPITTSASGCVTRSSRFWFTHDESSDPACATLRSAIDANCGLLNLGFVSLPNGFRNNDNVKDSEDAMIEALGFYWKSPKRTGEIGGTQNSKLKGSSLCQKRKKLAIELIAAIANSALFGTDPSQCSYVNAGTNQFFSSDLIDRAVSTAAGDDPLAMVNMTALLRLFNDGGQTNDLPAGIVECSPTSRKILKSLARDPTTQITCPGVNQTCDTAESVSFPNSSDPFASAVFKRSVTLSKFIDSVPSPSCGTGGRDATWQVKPTVGTAGRQFTVSTDGSNFDTMISVWTGTCSNLVELTTGGCANDVVGIGGEHLSFTTDGTNTYRIVVEGPTGNYGKLKLKVTSP